MWYSINGGTWKSTTNNNGTAGYYNLTVDCSAFDPFGPQSVSISLNHTYYQNKTLNYQFSVTGLSEVILIEPAQNATFFSDQIFNIIIYHNDTIDNKPINSTMWYSINGGAWQSTTVNNGTAGYYDLTIDCSTFDPYGSQIISISLNQTFYQNKTLNFYFIIYGATDLILINPFQNQLFNTNQTFSIVVYFNDTTKNQPIDGTMWYNINGGIWQSTIINNGTAGYYGISIDCSTFDPYGPQNIIISLNQTYYQNKTINYNFNVICLTELSTINLNQYVNKFSDESFNITIYFYDTNYGIGILGSLISYTINGTVYNQINEIGNGYYHITIYNWQICNDVGYGLIDITINANKTYYFNQTLVFHYYLYNATTQLIDQDTLVVIRSQNVTFSVFYLTNDSYPISGAKLQMISIDPNFFYIWGDNGDGSYYIELDTINVLGIGSIPYTIIFNISSQFNQTQIYSLNLYVWNRTSFKVNTLSQVNYTYNLNYDPWIIYYGEDVTFNISYFDTDHYNQLIFGAWGNFSLFNSTKNWDPVLIYTDINGYYYFTLSTKDLFTGIYNVKVKLNSTYFNSTVSIFQFKIIPCNVSYNIISLTQYGEVINLNNSIYESYFGDNITISINFLNSFSNNLIIGGFGNLTFNNQNYYYLDFDSDGIYTWEINTSQIGFGRYSFIVSFNKVNFQNKSFEIFFDINRFGINIAIIEQPEEVVLGDIFSITLNITNQFIGNPISNLNLSIFVDFGTFSWEASNITSINGLISFDIKVPLNATQINITIQFSGDNSFTASEVNLSINLNKDHDGVPNQLPLLPMFIILIVGASIGTGLVIAFKIKRSNSSETMAEDELKILSSNKPEEIITDFIQEDIIIRKSIETTKEIDKIIKKREIIEEKFMILNLDNLKDKIESNILVSTERAELNKELVENEANVEIFDQNFLVRQNELEELKNSINRLNHEGLNLIKKGELNKSLEKFKKIRALLRNYFK